MEINKINFEQIAKDLGITKSFEDLDVNNDGKINESDKNTAENSEIKTMISKVLTSDVDEDTECESDEIDYKEIFDELEAIKNSKNYDINGDGKVSYSDINALYSLIEHDPDEIFSDSLKVTKTRKDGLQYKAFEDAYTQKAKSAFQSVIKEISTQVRKDTSDKFNVCKSESSGDELQISDFIQLYNDLKNLPNDSLKGLNSSIDTTLLYYKNTFNLTTAYAQASDTEKAQLNQIIQELSSDNSKLSNILSKATCKNLKSTADTISENVNTYTNAVDDISSQLVNGDIPVGKSITFSLTSTNKITITNKNGTYVYHLKMQHTSYDGQTYYEDEYLTDKQIDSVLSYATDLVYANGTVGNTKNGTGLSSKVKDTLGANAVCGGNSYKVTNEKYVSEYTFTNEFGQTSTIYLRDCDECAGSPSNAVGDFLFANKIRGLLELAKSKSTTTQNNSTSSTQTSTINTETTTQNTTTQEETQSEKASSQKETLAEYDSILDEINENKLEKMKKEYNELLKQIENTEDEDEKSDLETKANKLKRKINLNNFIQN